MIDAHVHVCLALQRFTDTVSGTTNKRRKCISQFETTTSLSPATPWH